ncbi:MAG: hypothetical protein GY820_18960, partial [Gammaproteobacteria bacterium]|nr:hypothetical protein [Gammaproteobacteria bacterium]
MAPHLRGKLDAKTEPVRFLGFDIGTKAYRVLLLKTNNVVLRRDIVFIEDRFHLPRERRAASSGISSGASTIEVELSNVQSAPAPVPVEEEQEGEEQGEHPLPYINGEAAEPPQQLPPAQEVPPPETPLRRSTRERRPPQHYYDEDF